MTKSNLKKPTKSVRDQISKMTTKSEQIRFLNSVGHTRSEISKILTEYYGKLVRYQHVRNVLITPLKKN